MLAEERSRFLDQNVHFTHCHCQESETWKRLLLRFFGSTHILAHSRLLENMSSKFFWVLVWSNGTLDKDQLTIFGYFQKKGKHFVFINGIDNAFWSIFSENIKLHKIGESTMSCDETNLFIVVVNLKIKWVL